MKGKLYNDTVDQAYNESLKDNLLSIPKYYLTAKHGIRHTIVIHLIDYMENRGLKPSPDFLAATYLAGEDYNLEPLHSIQIQEYMQMILQLRENDYNETLTMFDNITDDEIVYLLIHLWVDLLFLDYNSKDKETNKFICNYIVYTDTVIKSLTRETKQIKNNEAFNTIIEVLFTEINIIRTQISDEGGLYDEL